MDIALGYASVTFHLPEWFGDVSRDYGFYDKNYHYHSGNRDESALWDAPFGHYDEVCTYPGSSWVVYQFDPSTVMWTEILTRQVELRQWCEEYKAKLDAEPKEKDDE